MAEEGEEDGPEQGHEGWYGHPIPSTTSEVEGEKPWPGTPLPCTDWVGTAYPEKCGDRVKWAPPAIGGRQGTPGTPASICVSLCLALLFGSLALSATLCVSYFV